MVSVYSLQPGYYISQYHVDIAGLTNITHSTISAFTHVTGSEPTLEGLRKLMAIK